MSKIRVLLILLAVSLLVGVASATIVALYPESTNQDGTVSRDTNAAYSAIRNGTGEGVDKTTADSRGFLLRSGSTTNGMSYMVRFGAIINTSSIPDDATINSAIFRAYVTSKNNAFYAPDIGLTLFSPASTSTIATADYNTWGTTRIATDIDYANITTGQYNNWTITNLTAINVTGYTSIMMRDQKDIDFVTPSWSSVKDASINIYDTSQGSNMVYLEVNYTPAAASEAPTAAFSADRTSAGTDGAIEFTDSSSEAPTSWLWQFGDGDTSTEQNPTHAYDTSGTFSVNMRATNGFGSDWENKTNYITINNYPDEYLNAYSTMIPWLDQGDLGWCSGYAPANALMLLRYDALGVTPTETQEPFTRDVWFSWSSYTVQGDSHVNYVPSMASIYWAFRTLDGSTGNKTILGNVLKNGVNLEADKFTPKYSALNYNYPQNGSYLASHKYNPIGDFITQDRAAGTWESLKRNISSNGVVILRIDVYSNGHDEPAGINYPLYADPVGSPTGGHWVAAVGYNSSLEEVYFLQTWGESRFGQTWTKVMGLSKEFWEYGSGTRSEFLVPMNITITEDLGESEPPEEPDPNPPVTDFTANRTTGAAPLAIAFTDTSLGTPTSWSWDFGDGNTSVEQNPVKVYETCGRSYTVALNATNDYGSEVETKTDYITTSACPPPPEESGAPTTGAVSSLTSRSVTFNAAADYGTTGYFKWGASSGTSYKWRTPNQTYSGTFTDFWYGSPMLTGHTYYVVACNDYGCGNEVSFTVPAASLPNQSAYGTGLITAMRSGFNATVLLGVLAAPYTSSVPGGAPVTWGLLFFFIITGYWLRHRDITIPAFLAMISGGAVWLGAGALGVPPEFAVIGQGLMYAAIAGMAVSWFSK